MLDLIAKTNSPINLENSFWLHKQTFWILGRDNYEFVKFNDQEEIEYLNGKGELVRKDKLEIDEDGVYKVSGNPYFKGIEFVNANEINLVLEVKSKEKDGSMVMKDIRFTLVKLLQSKIEVTAEQLKEIQSNSEWQFEKRKGKRERLISLSEWQSVSEEEVKRILNKAGSYSKQEETSHLIQLEDSLIVIEQKLDMVHHKGMVLKITNDELILVNHYKENEEYKLNRIK